MNEQKIHIFPPPLERNYELRDGRIQTRSLEAHIVDDCNLTCAECCSLSPFLPRWRASVSSVARSLELAARVLQPRVFKLVGGEPLLHPQIVEFVRVARRSEIAPTISITTNGLLLLRMPDELWEEVDALTISVYPQPGLSESAIEKIEERAENFRVAINWKHQNEFVVMTRPAPTDDVNETARIWSECWLRERCHMLGEGVFFTCTRPPHFQSMYRNRIDFSADGVQLHEGSGLASEILAYLHRQAPLAACFHCLGSSGASEPHRQMGRSEVARARSSLG